MAQDTIIIDCCRGGLAASAAFWSSALHLPITGEVEDGYARLLTAADEPAIVLHQVTHVGEARLDMETDNLDAEARRLQMLGARRTAFFRGRWWAMEAPDGQTFRLVNASIFTATRARSADRRIIARARTPRLRKRA